MTRPDAADGMPTIALVRAEYAGLIAAARASVAAADNGSPDPLVYVRAVLAARGHLPRRGASPLAVLSDSRTALHMAGWTGTRAVRPALEIAGATANPGPHDPTPPIAAPCGYLLLPEPGSKGGSGAFRDASSCAAHPAGHEVIPHRLSRAALYDITLDGAPESAGLARSWAARALAGCPAAADAVLAVSELVANAVLHSRSADVPGSIRGRLVIAPGKWLRCEIRDAGPGHPATVHDDARPCTAKSSRVEDADLPEHGRGTALVLSLSCEAGADGAGLAWFAMNWQPAADVVVANVPCQTRAGTPANAPRQEAASNA